MFILGAAVRFIHFALFDGTLLSPGAYALDTAVAIGGAALGFCTTRARQKGGPYGFFGTTTLKQRGETAPRRRKPRGFFQENPVTPSTQKGETKCRVKGGGE